MKHMVMSWWNSLTMLAPSNFKPLALVTLKTLLEVYAASLMMVLIALVISVPILLATGFLVLITQTPAGGDGYAVASWAFALFYSVNFFIVPFMAMSFYLWTLFLVARPSVELKDSSYFKRHVLFIVPATVFTALLLFSNSSFHEDMLLMARNYTVLGIIPKIPTWIVSLILPYIVFLYFFLLDVHSEYSNLIRAPWRAVKISVALLPIYALLAIVVYGLSFVLGNSGVGSLAWFFLIMPLFVVFMSRLYIITIHKNYKEYYERCW